MLELTFRRDSHVTKRTFRFKEIDSVTNKVLEQSDAAVGTLYVKKSVFVNESCPDEITVKLEW